MLLSCRKPMIRLGFRQIAFMVAVACTVCLDAAVAQPPTGLVYAVNPATYVRGTAIATNTPTNKGGTILTYSVAPALPSGLVLNTSNGRVSGIPTATSALSDYTVTGSNAAGSTSVVLKITVKEPAPSGLKYSTSSAVYTRGVSIVTNQPTNGGGLISSYSVAPVLPSGLALNPDTGVITGTPTVVIAPTTFSVTGANVSGKTTTSIKITVNDVAPYNISYALNPALYSFGVTVAANQPANSGGIVVSYAISPNLPAGLKLNTSTGVITGTPTSVSPLSNYIVKGTNTGGSSTTIVRLSVGKVAPTIAQFSASRAVIYSGQPVTLSWATVGSTSLNIDQGVGAVIGSSVVLHPSHSTTYTLTATNAFGTVTASVGIQVLPVQGAFTNVGNTTMPRYDHRATLLPSGKVLITGCAPGQREEVFDPTTGTISFTGITNVGHLQAHAATLLSNGKVLISGGAGAVVGEIYDPETNSFSPTGKMVTPRWAHTATLLPNGMVLIAGGSPAETDRSAELYDPSTNSFFPTGFMSEYRSDTTATLLPNGKVLIAGGTNGANLITAELYDPRTGMFRLISPMTIHRHRPTATLLGNGKVLLTGGAGSLPTAELYDPDTETFTPTGTMVEGRVLHRASLLPNGRVLLTAGGNGTALSSAEIYDPSTGVFTPTAYMSTPRFYHATTILADGRVLVTGGTPDGISFIYQMEIFDPQDPHPGAWHETSPLNIARYSHAAALLPDGDVLIVGGSNWPNDGSELYSWLTEKYTTTAAMDGYRPALTATTLPNGRVLIAGGWASTNGQLYDPSTHTFATLSSLAFPRRDHTATILPNGKILLAGGLPSGGMVATSHSELFDPESNSFVPTGPMTTERFFSGATILPNGKVLIIGGYDKNAWSQRTAELYDSATGTFSTTGSMATYRGPCTATLLRNGLVLVLGGADSGIAELYNPATGLFTQTGMLNQNRNWHTATLLPSGKVLIAGGEKNGVLASTEIFDPATGVFSLGAPMLHPRLYHTATLLPNGSVLISGGSSDYNTAIANSEIYIP